MRRKSGQFGGKIRLAHRAPRLGPKRAPLRLRLWFRASAPQARPGPCAMHMRESPPLRRLVSCACKRAGDGPVLGEGQLLRVRAADEHSQRPTSRANVLRNNPSGPSLRPGPAPGTRRAAGPLRDPITLHYDSNYERLLLCLLGYCLLTSVGVCTW